MKILKNIFLSVILLVSSYGIAFADGTDCSEPTVFDENDQPVVKAVDENTKTLTSKYFDLTLTKKVQSPLDNALPYELKIVSHMDTDKAQIIWNVPTALSVKTMHKEYVSLKNGETYTYYANIYPQKQGTYDFSVSVVAWQYDTNYTNSISDTVVFDSSMVSQPTTFLYQAGYIFKIVLIIALFGGIVYGVYRLAKKYSKKAKAWLTPPY